LRSYDEFEGQKKRRRKKSPDGGTARGIATDPAKITEDALHEAALRYLDRQDASVEQVRRVLGRRIFKYAEADARAAAVQLGERILSRLVESRLLDDERYARAYAESLRRRGASKPKLLAKLKSRGLSEEVIGGALEGLSGDEELSDEGAAATYARKRRLRERYNLDDPKERQKALAALARQGFSFDVARRVLGI
jgi:regulatory protein